MGGSVLLSEELKKLYRHQETNITNENLKKKIDMVTDEFERLLKESFKEFEQRPNPGIFDLYFKPVTRVKRGDSSDFLFDFENVPPN